MGKKKKKKVWLPSKPKKEHNGRFNEDDEEEADTERLRDRESDQQQIEIAGMLFPYCSLNFPKPYPNFL